VEVGIQVHFSPTVPLFAARISRVVPDGGTWRLKWERLKVGESNGKLPPRNCPGCSVPEPYRSHDWALVPAKPGLQGWILMNEINEFPIACTKICNWIVVQQNAWKHTMCTWVYGFPFLIFVWCISLCLIQKNNTKIRKFQLTSVPRTSFRMGLMGIQRRDCGNWNNTNKYVCFVDRASLHNHANKTKLMDNLFLVYFFLSIFIYLYMFRANMCPSSGETTVFMQHLVLVIVCGWLSGMQEHMLLHTRQPSAHNNKYQVLHKHSCFSWWWAHIRPKHVQINKYTKEKIH